MRIEQERAGVYRATVTAHELSVLLAGARMSLSLMEEDPSGSTERAREALRGVLSQADREIGRLAAAGDDGPA